MAAPTLSANDSKGHQRFPTMMLNISEDSHKIKETHSFKALVIGQTRSGKTSIIRRFVQNTFLSSYKMTLGAAQWQFKCQVPVTLMEEIPKDKNLIHSMSSFFNMSKSDKNILFDELKEDLDENNNNNNNNNNNDYDPFDADDKSADFGDNLYADYSHSLRVSSIADYGSFTVPKIVEENDIRKTSVNLTIDLEIIDVGFHPTEDKLYHDINSIILVIDYSNKESLDEGISKYQAFCNHLKHEKRQFVPILVAINKSDMNKKEKHLKKKDVKKIIKQKLTPIINEYFPENDKLNDKAKKKRNDTNATLLEVPNLSLVYNQKDKAKNNDSDGSDHDNNDNKEENDDDVDDDALSSAQKQVKPKKLKKSDLRYIDVISCSAKTGKNIEKIFETCIKKTLPAKLSQSVTHSRQMTTAMVTAPIWLRNIVDDFKRSSDNLHHPFFHVDKEVDDNFDFIEDDQ